MPHEPEPAHKDERNARDGEPANTHLVPADSTSNRQPQQDISSEQKIGLLQVRAALIAQSFSGPLPPPDALAKFEQVLPGLADRIMKMAEKQSAHRQSIERNVIEGDTRRSWMGLWS